MSNNQKGFSVLETILLVVVAFMIGGVAWYVWQSNQTNSEPGSQSNVANSESIQEESSKAQSDENSEVAIPEGYIAYDDENTQTSFYYPKNWGSLSVKNDPDPESRSRYFGIFSKNQYVKVSYAEKGWDSIGGGCSLTYRHVINSYPKTTAGDTSTRVVETMSGDAILKESVYYNDGCEKDNDFDIIYLKTNSQKFPVFGLVYEYDKSRSEQFSDFESVYKTLSVE